MLDDEIQLNFLVNFPAHLDVNRIILLELLHDYILLVLHYQLHPVLLEVGCGALPTHLLDQVVSGHEDSGTAEAQLDDEAFGPYPLPADVKEQVDEALDDELLQSFCTHPCLIDQADFLLELDDLMVLQLLVVDASLELFMHHNVRKPSDWRGEMGVVVQTQPKMTLVSVQVSRVYGEFLNLYGLQEQQLLQAIIDGFFLEELFELGLQVVQVIGFELDSQLGKVVIQVGKIAVQWLGVVDEERVDAEVVDQFLCDFAIGQDHEFFDHLLGVYPLLQADIDRDVGLIKLKHHFILIENFTVVSHLPPIEGNSPQQ